MVVRERRRGDSSVARRCVFTGSTSLLQAVELLLDEGGAEVARVRGLKLIADSRVVAVELETEAVESSLVERGAVLPESSAGAMARV